MSTLIDQHDDQEVAAVRVPVGLMFYLMGAVFIDRSSASGRGALNEAGRKAKEKGTR